MKKSRINILLNISALCLCLAAVAIGVYSVKNSQLTITGSVGFIAHDCKVRVLGKISGAYDKDGNKLTANNELATILFADDTDETKGKLITGTSEDNNWKFGNIYYNDLTAPNSFLAEDIVFTSEITNESVYDVMFKVVEPTNLPNNIVSSITVDNSSKTENDATLLSKNGDKVTVVLTLRLSSEENISNANNFSDMQFNFYKPSANDSVTTNDKNFKYQIYPATKTAAIAGFVRTMEHLSIPETITIGDDVYIVNRIAAKAFYNYTPAVYVGIPSSVTSIGDYAFSGCKNLKDIEIPNSVTSIGESTFYNCYKLTTINLPDKITSIGSFAFYNTGLTSITIPNEVTSIGSYAFIGCRDLTTTIGENWVKSDGTAVESTTLLKDITYDIKRA